MPIIMHLTHFKVLIYEPLILIFPGIIYFNNLSNPKRLFLDLTMALNIGSILSSLTAMITLDTGFLALST
ncbi:MAG: hypothetical protein ACFFB9_14385 [Promethearchaeota archaeon]